MEEARDDTPAGRLAEGLFASDPHITYVFLLGSEIFVERDGGWGRDRGGLETARRVIQEARLPRVAALSEAHSKRLREEHYNATIVGLREVHADLRVIRVQLDGGQPPFEPGQYATLGLGYWEPRVDGHPEDLKLRRLERLARRSYSVSSPIFDEGGGLLDWRRADWVEFYVVLVRGEGDPRDPPALTPRLFGKGVGERLYMSQRFLGHYTLEGVDPDDDVVFLATGTGEAPHNLMTLDLLLRGHRGRIVSVCCVRHRQDLAYLGTHRCLEAMFPRYRYIALVTRELAGGEKHYIQDLIRLGRLGKELGAPLSPDRAHVFLCGNPRMIGLPRWEGEALVFPSPQGVTELLVERGFTLDARGVRGNVHYEEYWKQEV